MNILIVSYTELYIVFLLFTFTFHPIFRNVLGKIANMITL